MEKRKRVTKKDWAEIASYISDTFAKRKRERKNRDKLWAEVDRQLKMEPIVRPEKEKNRNELGWMSDVELPWQSQTLETLIADTRRVLFPTDKKWFSANAQLEDDVLESLTSRSLIVGDNSDLKAERIDQEDLNGLVEALHRKYHNMYDMRGVWDDLNCSAMKYGLLVGRMKVVSTETYHHDYRGVFSDKKKFPVLVPIDPKNFYADDSKAFMTYGNQILRTGDIFCFRQHIDDLRMAAKGPTDPNNMDGGWIPNHLKDLEGDDDDLVTMIEYEGDLVVPRSSDDLFFPNVIVTVVQGKQDNKPSTRVVRFRFNQLPFRSYLTADYHRDDILFPYASSPLVRGAPVQRAATVIFNRLIDAGVLNIEPPVSYNPDDPFFAKNGGPKIVPRAKWATTDGVQTHEIGDMGGLMQVYSELVRQYQEITGVSSPRLGAQTKSHQTAFAIDAEIQRGAVRTVDYARSLMRGAMPTWLSMEYRLIKDNIKKERVFSEVHKGFVELQKSDLPEEVEYEVMGSAGPTEEREKDQKKLAALQMLTQLEPMAIQTGQKPMNWNEIRKELLIDGGFSNIDSILGQPVSAGQGVPIQAPGGQQVSGNTEQDPVDELVAMATGVTG